MSKAKPCPICKTKTEDKKFSPFCSARCGQMDLHQWMSEGYRIEAVEPPDNWETQIEQAQAEIDEKNIH